MSLAPETVAELRESWRIAAPQGEALTARFYEILFATLPKAAAMFSGTDMHGQGAKLGAALTLVVREADNPGKLLPVLHELGRRHDAYGVTPEDYETVGAALVSAMAETLGEAFSPSARAAWISAYGTVSGTMMAGATTLQLKSA